MHLRTLAVAMIGGLAFTSQAQAAETPGQELQAVYQCYFAEGLFAGLMRSEDIQMADADRALAVTLKGLDPRLEARERALTLLVGQDVAQTIADATRAAALRDLDPLRNDPEARPKIIALYRPVMEGCAVRAAALPAGA